MRDHLALSRRDALKLAAATTLGGAVAVDAAAAARPLPGAAAQEEGRAALHTRYLIDFEYLFDEETGYASMGHLLVFNPGSRDTSADVTIYFEDADPATFDFPVLAGQRLETNYTKWPVQPNSRFALAVASDEPLVCQATIGWNNSGNDYTPDAPTKDPDGVRECAKSYMAHTGLSRESFIADGIVLNLPDGLYVRESEWALLLNPGDEPAAVTMALHFAEPLLHQVEAPPRRLGRVYMDDLVEPNTGYGVRFTSDQPIAAQWQREVRWYDRPGVMTFWSVPAVPGV